MFTALYRFLFLPSGVTAEATTDLCLLLVQALLDADVRLERGSDISAYI